MPWRHVDAKLDGRQKSAFLASFLGWTLDAFDFFLMVFVLHAVATEFGTSVKAVSIAITLTLAMRPLGALVLGALADRPDGTFVSWPAHGTARLTDAFRRAPPRA